MQLQLFIIGITIQDLFISNFKKVLLHLFVLHSFRQHTSNLSTLCFNSNYH